MSEDEDFIDIGDDQGKYEPIQSVSKDLTEQQQQQQQQQQPQQPQQPQQQQEQQQPTWPTDPQTIDNDIDEQSRQLIEQMLAEEEYYYGKHTMPTQPKNKKKKKRKSSLEEETEEDELYSKKSKKEGRSSASLPSHKTRWSEEEDKRLKEALATYSYGNWKLISEYVKTRNPLQCKNHARHLQSSDKIPPPPSATIATTSTTPAIEPTPVPTPVPAPSQPTEIAQKETSVPMEIEDELSIDGEETQNNIPKQDLVESAHTEPEASSIEPDTIQTPIESPLDTSVSPSSLQKETKGMPETDKDQIEPTTPIDENRNKSATDTVQFDPYTISETEKLDNPEWFRQKYSKTPDRYLKIRNHMLACWQQCRPKYLTKTSARKGLKDCGDVNAIGRVHEYLESLGVINVNCITSAPRPPKRVAREPDQMDLDDLVDAAELVVGYDGPRKRKVRNERGDWVDPKELEGRVIEHGQVIIREDTKPKRIPKRHLHQHYYSGDDFSRGYDPFRLVPTSHYDEESPAPFDVEITSDALLVMDFHSHLAHTEIIGLLGGNFVVQGDTKLLQVKTVFPCKSTSTGIQCEMDPTSEMKAREEFAERGLNVVGWYHSHPTFEPHPSIRDIENQTSYQTLFRDEKTGDEPFIGVIVTPYDPEILSNHSQIQYLHISKQWNTSHLFRVPYACKRKVIQAEKVGQGILDQLTVLLDEYKDYEHKMNMVDSFGTQTRLGKLLDSLRAHLFINQEDQDHFLTTIKNVIMEKFVDN